MAMPRSRKATFPVGALPVTVAVNVTEVPDKDEGGELETVVAVAVEVALDDTVM
jgi:hypothetical protein